MTKEEKTGSGSRSAPTGAREWFDAEARRWRSRLVAVVRRVVRDPDMAEDVAQEALLHAWNGLGVLEDRLRFGPWLLRIGRNLAVDALRRRGRRPTEESLQRADLVADEPRECAASASSSWDERERRGLWRALADLPATERRLFLLRYGRGLDHAEIAWETGQSVVAVKVALHRGRRRLQERLAGEDEPQTGEARLRRA